MGGMHKALGCLCVTLVMSLTSQAKDWRGITPLHSTRADVEALFGAPDKGRSVYSLDEGEVFIVYSNEGISEAATCLRNLPAETVLLIRVTPKKETRLSDLPVVESRLTKFDSLYPPELGYEGYLDEAEGIVIRTLRGRVEQVVYIAASSDRQLCPAYYKDPQSFVGIACGLSVPPPPCPAITVAASEGAAKAGAIITFSVKLTGGDPGATPAYRWAVSAGRIVSGQGTATIGVDAAEAAGKTIKATVEVGGYDRACVSEASGETRIEAISDGNRSSAGGARKP